MIIQDIGKRKKLFDKKILMTGEKQRNKNNEPLTSVWQNGGFSAELKIRNSNKN
jgi:hypothetical protein